MHFEDQASTGITMPVGDEEYQAGAPVNAAVDDHLSVDTPFGPFDAGWAGYDTDDDGRNDTAVVTGPVGGTVLFTDVDGDGLADVATEITNQGRITVSEHAGDGRWTVVERGRLDADGYHEGPSARADDASTGFGSASSGSGSAGSTSTDVAGHLPADSVVSIDPITGRWTPD